MVVYIVHMHTHACASEEKPPPSKLLPLKHRIIKRGMLQGKARQGKEGVGEQDEVGWQQHCAARANRGPSSKDLLGSDSATDETGGLTD